MEETKAGKHTPGPWAVDNGRHGAPVVRVPGGRTLQQLVDDATFEANVRLIAAAPELLEALRSVVYLTGATAELDRDIVARAKAAIAKAEGNP